jgi:hypothetical protein
VSYKDLTMLKLVLTTGLCPQFAVANEVKSCSNPYTMYLRLRNDPGRVRQLLDSSRAVSYKDLTMLKLVLTSGLYPQFAVADEFNSYKAGQDQLFHTRVKPFNVLHPNSIFARHGGHVARMRSRSCCAKL